MIGTPISHLRTSNSNKSVLRLTCVLKHSGSSMVQVSNILKPRTKQDIIDDWYQSSDMKKNKSKTSWSCEMGDGSTYTQDPEGLILPLGPKPMYRGWEGALLAVKVGLIIPRNHIQDVLLPPELRLNSLRLWPQAIEELAEVEQPDQHSWLDLGDDCRFLQWWEIIKGIHKYNPGYQRNSTTLCNAALNNRLDSYRYYSTLHTWKGEIRSTESIICSHTGNTNQSNYHHYLCG
jgi:hypothetical protein